MMRLLLCALTASALAAGPALSHDAPNVAAQATEAAAKVSGPASSRTLYICDTSAMTRRAFAREFGAAEFVKAADVKAKGAAWPAPKCITASEARRLKQIASTR